MRLRTLPVSVAGVLMGAACALAYTPTIRVLPGILCLVFAVLAQIASNFANEYYDYRNGLDRPGREGPRRGVTEGDITPQAMLAATYTTLGLACAVGCTLLLWGSWWLVPAGIFIACGVAAYSTGPYPLSHHALGEVAVVLFYGLVPVTLTAYLMSGTLSIYAAMVGVGCGLLGANVLIVNNYRDRDDDAPVGKRTLAVAIGRRATALLYLMLGVAAPFFCLGVGCASMCVLRGAVFVSVISWCASIAIYRQLKVRSGAALTPMLGATAVALLVYAISLLAVVLLCR